MRNKILALIALAILPTQAMASKPVGTLGLIDNFTEAGFQFATQISTVIALYTRADNTTTSYGTFRKIGTTAGYAVTSGKTLTIYGIHIINTNGASGVAARGGLCYGDNDVGLATANTAPTNVAYIAGDTTNSQTLSTITAGTTQDSSPWFTIPATKFPCVFNANSTNAGMIATAWGEEN